MGASNSFEKSIEALSTRYRPRRSRSPAPVGVPEFKDMRNFEVWKDRAVEALERYRVSRRPAPTTREMNLLLLSSIDPVFLTLSGIQEDIVDQTNPEEIIRQIGVSLTFPPKVPTDSADKAVPDSSTPPAVPRPVLSGNPHTGGTDDECSSDSTFDTLDLSSGWLRFLDDAEEENKGEGQGKPPQREACRKPEPDRRVLGELPPTPKRTTLSADESKKLTLNMIKTLESRYGDNNRHRDLEPPFVRNLSPQGARPKLPVARRQLNLTRDPLPPQCALCPYQHLTSRCDKWVGLDLEERYRLARNNRLCMSCLERNHLTTCAFVQLDLNRNLGFESPTKGTTTPTTISRTTTNTQTRHILKRKPCLMCGSSHSITRCRDFIAAPVRRRKTLAVNGKLCLHCLNHREDHNPMGICKVKGSTPCGVKHCTEWHHPLLHEEDRVPPKPKTSGYCAYCNLDHHCVEVCDDFRRLTPPERRQLVHRRSLCEHCLEGPRKAPTIHFTECWAQRPHLCGIQGGLSFHHPLLH